MSKQHTRRRAKFYGQRNHDVKTRTHDGSLFSKENPLHHPDYERANKQLVAQRKATDSDVHEFLKTQQDPYEELGEAGYHTLDCVFQGMVDSSLDPIPYGAPGCSCPGTAERKFLDAVVEEGGYAG